MIPRIDRDLRDQKNCHRPLHKLIKFATIPAARQHNYDTLLIVNHP